MSEGVCLLLSAAAIIEYGSYRIALHAMGGAFGLTLILVFFWMPESAYMREALNIDTGETNVRISSAISKYISLTSLDCGGREGKTATTRALA